MVRIRKKEKVELTNKNIVVGLMRIFLLGMEKMSKREIMKDREDRIREKKGVWPVWWYRFSKTVRIRWMKSVGIVSSGWVSLLVVPISKRY